MVDLAALCWTEAMVPEAIASLARHAGMTVTGGWTATGTHPLDRGRLRQWIEATAQWCGVEAASIHVTYADLPATLREVQPMLMQVGAPGESRFVAIAGTIRGRCAVLAPDQTIRRIAADELLRACAPPVPLAASLDAVLKELPRRLRERSRAALMRERLDAARVPGCWVIRACADAPFLTLLRRANVPRRLALLSLAHLLAYAGWLASWWVIGWLALSGRLDRGWLAAWALLLISIVPLRAVASRMQGLISVSVGALIKRRLMAGALKMDADEVRREGIGQLLGRIIESEAIESLALSGGFLSLFAVAELFVSLFVLAAGAGAPLHPVMLIFWIGLVMAQSWRYFTRRREWTVARMHLTNDLVEHLVGHRTRVAQQRPEAWHVDEDENLSRLMVAAKQMDSSDMILRAVAARGWLLIGVAGLVPAIMSGRSVASIAVALGGVLLAHQAFRKLSAGLSHVAGALVAWESVRPVFTAAGRPVRRSPPYLSAARGQHVTGPALEAHDVVYRYRSDDPPVLRSLRLRAHEGDRLLIEGESGSGKSTLAMVLAGLRRPQTGLVLTNGRDHGTLGDAGWRRHVTLVPQFHDNYVLSATLAFNLLMGRRWPPSAEDLRDADGVCRELGLGDLLDKLPSGLLTMVGDTGWQLSHGERTRVFIARALLQDPTVVILDESFAALDPITLRQAMACVTARARTLLVIAHP